MDEGANCFIGYPGECGEPISSARLRLWLLTAETAEEPSLKIEKGGSLVATALTFFQPPIDTPACVCRRCRCFGAETAVAEILEWAESLGDEHTQVGTIELCELTGEYS
jgi:hypothetical protein